MQHPEIGVIALRSRAHEARMRWRRFSAPVNYVEKGKTAPTQHNTLTRGVSNGSEHYWIETRRMRKSAALRDMVRIHSTHAGFAKSGGSETPRIIPGVVAMRAGARWQPDEERY